jgi:hypothetical protein
MDDPILPVWVTAYATIGLAITTLLLALVAAFQDKIRSWLLRPALNVSFKMSPPDCIKTKIAVMSPSFGDKEADCYYFRLRVSNRGNHPATNVEVYASELHRRKDDGIWSKVDQFQPMNLKWANLGQPVLPIIHRGMEKLCDVGHIIDPAKRPQFFFDQPPSHLLTDPALTGKASMSLDLEVIPFTFSHILLPGTYRLKLMIAATELHPITQVIEIELLGTWHETESLFLGSCINMSLVETTD